MTTPGEGLDLSDFVELSDEEKNSNLMHVWSWRGPLYELSANSLMMDYAPPAFSKLHRAGSDLFGRPDLVNIILLGAPNLASYVMLGWETGIFNQINSLRRNGMPIEQCMELVMFTQLYAGMRGLGHTFRAVGDFLPAMGPPSVPLPLPEGWEVDAEAFKSGLDFSTRKMTSADVENLTGWYERNIGYLPNSIKFGLKYHPEFVKVNRGKWEVGIRTLPKQFAPLLMVRMNMMSGCVEGLREAVLLGRSWGIARDHVIQGISSTVMFFTAFEGYHTAFRAVDDILESWT
jgi:hypothetical protein